MNVGPPGCLLPDQPFHLVHLSNSLKRNCEKFISIKFYRNKAENLCHFFKEQACSC